MIKTRNGKVRVKGELCEIMADYSLITGRLVKLFEKEGFSKDTAVEMVQDAHKHGLMTPMEIRKEIIEKIGKVLSEISIMSEEELRKEIEKLEKENEADE